MQKHFNIAARLSHVALQVRDVETSIAFYRKWLGMEVISDDAQGVGEERVVLMACPGQEKEMMLVLLSGGNDAPKKEGMRHIGFDISSKEEILAIARAADDAGILHWQAKEHPFGLLCSIVDPDGHIIEFVEAASWDRASSNDNAKPHNNAATPKQR